MMRYLCGAVLATTLVCLAPRSAQAQGSIDGFGGVSLNRLDTVNGSTVPVDFGGRLSVNLAPAVQVIGEAGRLGNLLPPTTSLLLSFTPVDLRVRAFYGEGGVRVISSPRSAVRPYAEATFGVARLDVNFAGLNSTVDTATRVALNLLGRTEPMAGVGGGVMIGGGPILVDLGYRYKQVLGNDVLTSVVGAGQRLQVHQVRFGVGVRF